MTTGIPLRGAGVGIGVVVAVGLGVGVGLGLRASTWNAAVNRVQIRIKRIIQ